MKSKKHLKECISALINYFVEDVRDRDLVCLRIRNTEDIQDKEVGISMRRRDQLKVDGAGACWAKSFTAIQHSA